MRRTITIAAFAVMFATVSPGVALAEETPGAAEAGDFAGQALAIGDFDGDGINDLTIGAPGEAIGSEPGAGAVTVVYGSVNGLVEAGGQLFSQDTNLIAGVAEAADSFGAALAAGDFNGDGFDDLAVGVPGEDAAASNSGVVNVIYGSPTGLTANGNEMRDQDGSGVPDTAEPDDRLGTALAAGDFDLDGRDDLAIGVPQEDLGTVASAGAVNVIYGSPAGLDPVAAADFWHQQLTGVLGEATANDMFGLALITADFDLNGRRDLAIGAPFDTVNGVTSAGAVNVLYSTAAGLGDVDDDYWHQGVAGIPGTLEPGDNFGFSLAAANFGGAGQPDLAVGVPFEAVGGLDDAGAVNVLYAAASGLGVNGSQLLHQDVAGMLGTAQAGDRFGHALAAGNVGKSGIGDLTVGIVEEPVAGVLRAGAVQAVYGADTGLVPTDNELWHQNVAGIADSLETNDQFGRALAFGQLGQLGLQGDLAVGVPFEDIGNPALTTAGAVHVVYGSTNGLTATNSQLWTQGLP